jgi:hypothetical protein
VAEVVTVCELKISRDSLGAEQITHGSIILPEYT